MFPPCAWRSNSSEEAWDDETVDNMLLWSHVGHYLSFSRSAGARRFLVADISTCHALNFRGESGQ